MKTSTRENKEALAAYNTFKQYTDIRKERLMLLYKLAIMTYGEYTPELLEEVRGEEDEEEN